MAESTYIQAEPRAELLTAALHALEEGVAVLDSESRVLLWNPAAVAMTGYASADLLSRRLPVNFYKIEAQHQAAQDGGGEQWMIVAPKEPVALPERPVQVMLRHRQGHSLPAMLRRMPLRDAMGKRFGTLMRFHPIEEIDTLPHGEANETDAPDRRVEQSQAEMEDRLDEAWNHFAASGVPFGLLWVGIDQGAALRKTHGRDASEAMLAIVERTLLHALRPAEILGRWGVNEFLVLCHERSEEMLAAHAQHLTGLARTADFRWWGDRVPLTLSAGAAQAAEGDSLRSLLLRAQEGMQESSYAGGNRATLKKPARGQECSQS
jgi:diguanylate cyclase (GGDEF)-like protein/PAS domain S-box-containing protein